MSWMLMPLRKYAQFSGRSQRKEFWMFALLIIIGYFVLAMIGGIVGFGHIGALGTVASPAGVVSAMAPLFILIGLFGLAIFLPALAVSMRRLHDIDRTGWWAGGSLLLSLARYLVMMVNYATVGRYDTGTTALTVLTMILGLSGLVLNITLIVFYCIDGTKGPNRFGPDPKAHMSDLAKRFS